MQREPSVRSQVPIHHKAVRFMPGRQSFQTVPPFAEASRNFCTDSVSRLENVLADMADSFRAEPSPEKTTSACSPASPPPAET